MIELKLRAWNKEAKRMCEPESLSSLLHGEMNNGIAMGHADMKQYPIEDREHHIDHLIIMQYTGLKDKHGNDGYHKDILNNGFEDNWVIEWSEIDGNFYLESLLGYDPLPLRKIREMVLIGNIYENPKLLEV